jgi:hypothetical protein
MNRAENAKEMEEHEENVAGKPARVLPRIFTLCTVFRQVIDLAGSEDDDI